MRMVGIIDNHDDARRFSDFLTQSDIENKITEEDSPAGRTFEIWVYSEEDVERSEELLRLFLQDPEGEPYSGVEEKARKIKREARREEKDAPLYLDGRATILSRGVPPRGMITMIIILICIAVGVFSRLGDNPDMLNPLLISGLQKEAPLLAPGLPEIKNGEIWRLFSPMLIHFGILHLLFNIMWLMDLGSMVEDRKGSIFFIAFVLIVSASSNLAQYISSLNVFGGLSGVVYGLLGYTWTKGKNDPASRLYLHPDTVLFMLIWYFLCLFDVIPHIANAAHTVGLAIGISWGYLSSPKFKNLFKTNKK